MGSACSSASSTRVEPMQKQPPRAAGSNASVGLAGDTQGTRASAKGPTNGGWVAQEAPRTTTQAFFQEEEARAQDELQVRRVRKPSLSAASREEKISALISQLETLGVFIPLSDTPQQQQQQQQLQQLQQQGAGGITPSPPSPSTHHPNAPMPSAPQAPTTAIPLAPLASLTPALSRKDGGGSLKPLEPLSAPRGSLPNIPDALHMHAGKQALEPLRGAEAFKRTADAQEKLLERQSEDMTRLETELKAQKTKYEKRIKHLKNKATTRQIEHDAACLEWKNKCDAMAAEARKKCDAIAQEWKRKYDAIVEERDALLKSTDPDSPDKRKSGRDSAAEEEKGEEKEEQARKSKATPMFGKAASLGPEDEEGDMDDPKQFLILELSEQVAELDEELRRAQERIAELEAEREGR